MEILHFLYMSSTTLSTIGFLYLIYRQLRHKAIRKERLSGQRRKIHRDQMRHRMAAMQGMLVKSRDPEMIGMLNNLGILLRYANRQEAKIRPYQLRVMMRQAEAATKSFVHMPQTIESRQTYLAHLRSVAAKLAEGEVWGEQA